MTWFLSRDKNTLVEVTIHRRPREGKVQAWDDRREAQGFRYSCFHLAPRGETKRTGIAPLVAGRPSPAYFTTDTDT